MAGTSRDTIITQDEDTNPSVWAPPDAQNAPAALLDLSSLLKDAMSQGGVKQPESQPSVSQMKMYDAAPEPTLKRSAPEPWTGKGKGIGKKSKIYK